VGRRNEYFGTGESFLFSFPHAPSSSSLDGHDSGSESLRNSTSSKKETRESSVSEHDYFKKKLQKLNIKAKVKSCRSIFFARMAIIGFVL